MRKILCTDYSTRICTELNYDVPNFILFHFLFYFTYLRRHLYCILTAFNVKRISNNQSICILLLLLVVVLLNVKTAIILLYNILKTFY